MLTQPTRSTAIDLHGAAAPPEPRVQTARTTWRYPADAGKRDLRIDFLRGLAIAFVVVDHIDLFSAYHVISHERIGIVTGAELFVMLSGLVLGMVHRRRAIEEGWRAVAGRMWARAWLLYLTCLTVLSSAFLLSHLPFIDGDELTTFTDEATGTVTSMFGSTPLLTDYPVPPSAVLDLLFLNVGPWQFSVIGLYVILLAAAPGIMRLLLAGYWWVALIGSGALYGLNEFMQWRVFPSQFENQFPLLSWQLLFVLGMLVGFYWKAVLAWFDRPLGRAVVLLAFVACAGFLFLTSNNPAKADDPWSLRLDMIPEQTFWRLYEDWFYRDFLGLLRVVNVVVFLIVAYAVLTRIWVPLNWLLGWLLIPLGGATLYVFILHLVFAVIVASIPVSDGASLWVNTAVHTGILLTLWLMVQGKVLFRWIPR